MANSLKMKVIAEGVETEEQLAFLRYQQCDEIKGFLCKPAVTAEEFSKLLKEKWRLSL
jgi:EAL domain-containing protein (putative c-di-GMP-specific phosphodiesterase class I)